MRYVRERGRYERGSVQKSGTRYRSEANRDAYRHDAATRMRARRHTRSEFYYHDDVIRFARRCCFKVEEC